MSSDLSKQEKKALKHQGKAYKHEDKAARKQEKKMRKQMKKDNKHHLHDSHGVVDPALPVGTGLAAREGVPVVHTAAVPVVPVAPMQHMSLGDKVVHEAERVIHHEPLREKEIINERPVEVKHEHHIQPVVHETEHRIQPVIKTEATTETNYIVKDKNVMLPPIIEPAHMVGATAPFPTTARSAAVGAMPLRDGYGHDHLHEHGHGGDKHLHKHDKHVDRDLYKRDKHLRKQEKHLRKQHMHHQNMMAMGGHPGFNHYGYNHNHNMMMMPMMGGRGHYNHPMMMQRGLGGGYGYGQSFDQSDRLLDAEQRLHWGMVAPMAPGEKVIPIDGVATSGGALSGLKEKLHLGGHGHGHSHNHDELARSQLVEPSAPGMSGVETGSMQNRAGFGQKIKGAMKEVQGAITRNPAKKEEGKMIMQGVDPATASSATGAATHAPTTATTAI